MSKPLSQNNVILTKQTETNTVSTSINFDSIFHTKPLDNLDSIRIEKLLVDNFQPGTKEEDQVFQDSDKIKKITAEIRAIGRQGTVLTGQRVHQAKEILKLYKEGTFTKWLDSTFGNRKTGYNFLAYFEQHESLPNENLRDKFKKLPLRAAYVLSSRSGSSEIKQEIVREYHDLCHSDLVAIIQERLPVATEDKRTKKSSNERVITQINDLVKKLQKRKDCLSDEDKFAMDKIRDVLSSII